jgi:hypothetical protein
MADRRASAKSFAARRIEALLGDATWSSQCCCLLSRHAHTVADSRTHWLTEVD